MANPVPKILNLNFSYLIVSVRRPYYTCASFFCRFFFCVNVCHMTFFNAMSFAVQSSVCPPVTLSPCLCVPFSPLSSCACWICAVCGCGVCVCVFLLCCGCVVCCCVLLCVCIVVLCVCVCVWMWCVAHTLKITVYIYIQIYMSALLFFAH